MFTEREKQQQTVNQTLVEDMQKLQKNFDTVVKNYEEKNKELFNTF